MLLNFPLEVIHLILDEVSEPADLKRLCEVSKRFYEIATPRLYENVVIEQDLRDSSLPLEPLLRPCSWHKHRLQLVKSLRFCLPRHQKVTDEEEHCLHNFPIPGGVDEVEDSWHDSFDFFVNPYSPVSSLLDQLKDNNLHTFSWDLKTCIPVGLFGEDGYLATRQNRIRSLSLITDSRCPYDTADGTLDLTSFKHLRDFSWKNIRTENETLQAFKSWLQSDIPSLETLELSFALIPEDLDLTHDQPGQYVPTPGSNLFFDVSRDIISGARFPKFPSLKSLTLTAAYIAPVYPEIARFFNFSRLQTLRLRSCPNANRLLDAVVKSRIPIQLKTFELVTFMEVFRGCSALVSFLKSFRGLEQLYLDVEHQVEEVPDYIQTIAEHRSTLKRLAYRAVQLDIDLLCDGDSYPEPEFTPQICDSMKSLGTSILEQGKLECFSFCASLVFLKSILRAPIRRTLKLLHIIDEKVSYCDGDIRDNEESFYSFFSTDEEDLVGLRFPEERTANIEESLADTLPLNSPPHTAQCDWMDYRNALRCFTYWAFNDGLPGLQYLSYGDFSYGYFGYPCNVVFCRDPSEESMFKILKSSDDMMHFERTYGDFLSTLPPC